MPKSQDINDQKIFKLLKKLIDAQIFSLVITGGEPLTRPKTVTEIIRLSKNAGISVSINTNLLLLTDQLLTKFKELNVDSLLVSCPASDITTYKQITRLGDYNQFKLKLKLLLKSHIPCLVNMVVTKENLSFIRSTAKDLAKLGLKRFAATPASPNVEHCGQQNELLNKEQIVKLLEALKWCSEKLDLKVDVVEPLPKCFLPKWCWEKDYSFTQRSCQAGRNSVSISNTGDVRLCSHNPTIYGNLFLESLESIWKRINDSKDSYVPTECHQCPSLSFCHGACRIDSLITTGLLNKPNPLMTGHISPPKENEAIIKDEAIISFEGKLKWRKETNYYYSVCSKNHPLNLTTVNDEFFNFLVWLEKCPPLTIKDLFKRCATNSDRVTFDKIIKILLRKKFVKILDL